MISLQVCIDNTDSDAYFREYQGQLVGLGVQPTVHHLLCHDEKIVGIEGHFHRDGVVDSSFALTEKISTQDAVDLIATLIESYIRRYHCVRIIIHTNDQRLVHAYRMGLSMM